MRSSLCQLPKIVQFVYGTFTAINPQELCYNHEFLDNTDIITIIE